MPTPTADLNTLILGSPNLNPFIAVEVVEDDLRCIRVSQSAIAFYQDLGLPPLREGDLLCERLPRHKVQQPYQLEPLYESYRRVAKTGVPWQREICFKGGEVNGEYTIDAIFEVSVCQLIPDQALISWRDVSRERGYLGEAPDVARSLAALSNGEMQLYGQPIFRLSDMQIVGYEGLIRWPQGDGIARRPGEFLPGLDEAGYALNVFWFTVQEALKHLQKLDERLAIAVNLSAACIAAPDFPKKLGVLCNEQGVDRARLEIEVTEEGAVNPASEEKLREAATWHRVKADDVGAKFANFGQLLHLRGIISVLKVDISLIRGIAEDDGKQGIFKAIAIVAETLDCKLVAEGIQDEADLDWLKANGCGYGQGFWLGKPEPFPLA